MACQSLSLRVTRLEDRVTPSITPNDVFAAIGQTQATEELLRTLGSQLGIPRGDLSKQYMLAVLPVIQVQAQQAATVLGQFRQALELQQQGNPELAGFLAPFVDATKQTEVQAILNAGYAELYASGFRADLARREPVPPTVPPPTPPLPVDLNNLLNPDGSINLPGENTGSDGSTTINPGLPTDNNDQVVTDPGQVAISTTIPDLAAAQWQSLASGLRVWDVVTGSGATVQPGQTVTVDYVGWLTDGSTFDSSVDRGVPATFSLNQVIQGWQEGIPGMRIGGIRRLDIPASLAYGNSPPPGSSIPPNARLIFEVQMISIS